MKDPLQTTNIKRGKFQQITKKTNLGKLQSRRGWVVITNTDCIGLYSSKWEAKDSCSGYDIMAIIPVVVDFYVGNGL